MPKVIPLLLIKSEERGGSLLAIVFLLSLLSIMGWTLVSLVSTNQTVRTDLISQDQATFTNLAGIEYALQRFYEGRSPEVAETILGRGSFHVERDGSSVMVTSRSGPSQVLHSVSLPTQADCLLIDTSESHTHDRGSELARIWLTKRCGEEVVLDKMVLSWESDGGESYEKVRLSSISDSRLYDAPPVIQSGELVDLIDGRMRRNQRYKLKEIRYRKVEGVGRPDMRQKDSFRLKLFFGDGSSQEVHFTLAACPHSSC
ncbi:MAG: hypothetical protein HYT76_06935 [Deltaproteobacteria bacterium]|nr:hypothetical protein [Deltaproteobacteria bacterium]